MASTSVPDASMIIFLDSENSFDLMSEVAMNPGIFLIQSNDELVASDHLFLDQVVMLPILELSEEPKLLLKLH